VNSTFCVAASVYLEPGDQVTLSGSRVVASVSPVSTTGPPGRRVDGLFDYDYNLIIWISVNFGKLATFGVDSDSHAV
jgi:hypothetical protein